MLRKISRMGRAGRGRAVICVQVRWPMQATRSWKRAEEKFRSQINAMNRTGLTRLRVGLDEAIVGRVGAWIGYGYKEEEEF